MAGELEKALYAQLVGWEYLSGLMGQRVFPVVIPEDAELPAVAYQRISGPRLLAHDGPTGLAEGRVQVTVVGTSYAEAKEIAAGIRSRLEGRRGILGNACEVFSCRVENEVDGWGDQIEANTVRLDLWFLYRE
jgi:hypothetical protein